MPAVLIIAKNVLNSNFSVAVTVFCSEKMKAGDKIVNN